MNSMTRFEAMLGIIQQAFWIKGYPYKYLARSPQIGFWCVSCVVEILKGPGIIPHEFLPDPSPNKFYEYLTIERGFPAVPRAEATAGMVVALMTRTATPYASHFEVLIDDCGTTVAAKGPGYGIPDGDFDKNNKDLAFVMQRQLPAEWPDRDMVFIDVLDGLEG